MFLTVATEVTPEIPVGNLEILPEHCEFSKYIFPMTEYKKDKATIYFLNFFH